MKKVVTLITVCALALTFLLQASAALTPDESSSVISNQTVQYFSDGSSLVIITTEDTGMRAMATTSTKSGSKIYYLRNEDYEVLWSVTVHGAFTYNGTTATCTSSSVSYTVENDNWRMISAEALKAGNAAIGNFTARKYFLGIPIKTQELQIVLRCSPTGVLS